MKLIKKKIDLFISVVVIFETEWVLRSFYKFKKEDILNIFQKLFLISEIKFENNEIFSKCFELMNKNNFGLEDNYHLAFCQTQNMELVTFDKQLNKKIL